MKHRLTTAAALCATVVTVICAPSALAIAAAGAGAGPPGGLANPAGNPARSSHQAQEQPGPLPIHA
jgi:hypothetical protein